MRNRRVARQDASGGWTYFTFGSGGVPLAEVGLSEGRWRTEREYVWLEDLPLAQVEHVAAQAASVYYFHVDDIGMPRAMTNGAGQTVWSAVTHPYGELVETVTPDPLSGRSVVTNLRLPGQSSRLDEGEAGSVEPYGPAVGKRRHTGW